MVEHPPCTVKKIAEPDKTVRSILSFIGNLGENGMESGGKRSRTNVKRATNPILWESQLLKNREATNISMEKKSILKKQTSP
jgi:hypothetical protein